MDITSGGKIIILIILLSISSVVSAADHRQQCLKEAKEYVNQLNMQNITDGVPQVTYDIDGTPQLKEWKKYGPKDVQRYYDQCVNSWRQVEQEQNDIDYYRAR